MSSDSDDDCYGNVAQQLQKMKNNYLVDKIETTNLLDDSVINENDSAELDAIVKNNQKLVKKIAKRGAIPKNDDSNSSENLPDVSAALTPESSMIRTTRSRAKRNTNNSPLPELPTKRSRKRKTETTPSTSCEPQNVVESPKLPVVTNQRGRGRGRGSSTCNDQNEVVSLNVPVVANQRGRRRGRGRSPKGRRRRGNWGWRDMAMMADFFAALRPMNVDASIPTYSVGNTDDYNDQSDSQALFQTQTKKTDDVIIVEQDVSLEENEELSVKVYWQSSEFFKFSIRKYQKICQIFDYFANKEKVEKDKLLFTFNDRILKPDDTPDSIGYSIVKFIDGGIVKQSVVQIVSKDDQVTSGIKLKFQCQNLKKPFELSVCPDDKMSVAMLKCAEHLETPLDRLRFEFDGDLIPGKATANELELEGGECIDVKILS